MTDLRAPLQPASLIRHPILLRPHYSRLMLHSLLLPAIAQKKLSMAHQSNKWPMLAK